MEGYRLYFLDDHGHIRHAKDLSCSSDQAAIEMVEQHRDGSDMELWQRDRLVKAISKTPSPGP
jgi:hypothetical protein